MIDYTKLCEGGWSEATDAVLQILRTEANVECQKMLTDEEYHAYKSMRANASQNSYNSRAHRMRKENPEAWANNELHLSVEYGQ